MTSDAQRSPRQGHDLYSGIERALVVAVVRQRFQNRGRQVFLM